MILRSSALRHGRQVLRAAPCRAAPSNLRVLSTDGRPPPRPTANAEPPSSTTTTTSNESADPTDPSSTLATDTATTEPAAAAPLWQVPTASPMALWNRQRRVRVDLSIAENFRRREAIQEKIGKLGSEVERRFNPSGLLQDPPRPEDVTLELLMAAQCHMGHNASLWNPANQRYIYGVRSGIHIISLEEIAASLRRAARVVEEVAYLGGLMLFVGNRKGQMEVTARAAELAGACHLFSKWVPGTITNRDQILGREELKVVDERDQKLPGFERHLLERRPLMPELVVVLNPLENYTLLHECAQENIPTIGLIDTNADPTQVTYAIPGNDDSLRSVSVIAGVLGRAGERGQKRRLADANRGVCTWRNPADLVMWMEQNEAAMKDKAEADGKDLEGRKAVKGKFKGVEGDDSAVSAVMEQLRL
ncbi:ribosomal protein S2 [Cryphonectria parasitica EP155]|uniref:Ribosomal protein S2 n=1 Tax=Cryphonectria parasitica (strain ATCC 38755 / EP155) TaxID=660469 RepID=A0A9P4XYA7_CRYP1|nr:ribosomal protein S2 [Cryphonectria parasitica EP155]KAF3763017.1 ribosomal protein S2 [Cryphonectria parasitica EP155]